MILDNVNNVREVEPLLPSTDSWSVILTMRPHDIRAAKREFKTIEMEGFEQEESKELFYTHFERAGKQLDEPSSAKLAALLSHHPLALNIAASQLAYEDKFTVQEFVEQLRNSDSFFDELEDTQWNIRASLRLSYDQLDASLQQTFQALSVFHGDSFKP